MDILKPWLAATLEGELSEAIRHKENGTNIHGSIQKSQGLWYDDGSNLRIPSAQKGPVVQITKFLTFEEPIQVTLSDSMIRVNASITNQSSQRYAKEYRRKLTDGTVGGLIQLHEFEIVATHLGPRDKRLTLYVQNFKCLSSDRSSTFGVAPQAIEGRARTKELLKKLAGLREHESDAHFKQSASSSPIKSQSNTQISEAGTNQASQVGFATQLSRPNAPTVSKLKPQELITSIDIGSSSTVNTMKSCVPPMKDKHGGPAVNTLNSLQIPAAPQGPSVSGKAALLLGLLQSHGRVPRAPELTSGPSTETPRGRTAVSIRPTVNQGENEASSDMTRASGGENASKTLIGTQKRKRRSPENSPQKKAGDDDDSEGVDKDCEGLVSKDDLDKKGRSEAAVNEASTSTLHSQPASPPKTDAANLHLNVLLEPPVLQSSELTSSASGRNRISSREVNIPKAQETLLNRADSWLPAEPGQREPTANIPISLLKTLNRKAGLRAHRSTGIRKQRNGTVIPNAVIDQTNDSESDVPVSSGRWPASPERDQLPPDSSMASAERSDHSIQRIADNLRSVSSSRRQSHASSSSRSMPSERPSPMSARYFLRESVSPSLISPDLSPSGTSTSAGEEVHRFSCQVLGCNKSYKKPGSMEYHVKRHHPGTESFEDSKCSIGDWARSYASPNDLKYHTERHHNGNKAPSSYSGIATPTVSGASTLMFPNLKAQSEHDRRPGRESVDSGPDNESDPVASKLSLTDRESTVGDKEPSRRHPGTSTALNGDLPPDPQPALVRSTATNLHETHVTKGTLSPLLPASPTPDSDLEMTVPLALNEGVGSFVSSAPMQHFPSTVSQEQDPFTQVERTPYVDGRAHSKSVPGSKALFSQLKENHPLPNDAMNDDVEFVSASFVTGPEVSTGGSHGESGNSKGVEDQVFETQCIENPVAGLTEESNGQNVTDRVFEKTCQSITQVQREPGVVEAAIGRPEDSSKNITGSQSRTSGLNKPYVAPKPNAKPQAISGTMPISEDGHIDPLSQVPASHHTAQFAHEMKRKVVEPSLLSPGANKRQRRFKVPRAFTFNESSELRRDPSEGARQYRQDFLASRRSSGSSTPTMSPTVSFTVVPGTTSENFRDPPERPGQGLLEFLASRRGSDPIAPSTSPRKHSTAPTGTNQIGQQNAEAEKNIGGMTVQKESVDTEIERQKMTVLEEMLARSPRQEMELDAITLSNGVASTATEGYHAKLGAQDDLSRDDQADSRILVAQNSDIEGPDAEQSIVNESSSYPFINEAQPALSTELSLSFQLQAQQEAEHDLAGTKDDIDTSVGVEISPVLASNGQLAGTDENGLSSHSDQDEARIGLPARPEGGAEQGENAPRPESINQVAEPNTAALESVHQQQLIEEDTDIPMPDVPIDHDITTLKPVADIDEPINRIIPLSTAATTFVAESNTENQPHLSSAAAIQLSKPTLEFEVRSNEERQNAVQPPIEIVEQKRSSVPRNIFYKFKATYPAYPGDMNHFAAICRKISQLVKANRMEHQSLWDDFIVKHKTEYPLYLRRCAEEAEDAISYEDFYQDRIDEPRYQDRVISQRNLDDALALVLQRSNIKHVHAEPINGDKPRTELVKSASVSETDTGTETMHYEYVLTNDDESREPVGTKFAIGSATHDETARKPSEPRSTIDTSAAMVHNKVVISNELPAESKPRITIDLTGDDPPGDQPESPKARMTIPRSSVPNLVNALSFEPPPLQDRRDSSGSLDPEPHTTSATQSLHVPPQLRSHRSRVVAYKNAASEASARNRRSLPWKGSDHSTPQSSPNTIARDSPKSFSGPNPQEVRTKGSPNADNLRLQVSANSTPKDVKQTQGMLNSCHRVIQSNWGNKAHELLEPEYYGGQELSGTMIELLAEIASRVNYDEARNQIKQAIDTRIKGNAGRGAGHPIQDWKILKSDLEVVREVVETSSMDTASPFPPPHTNAAIEKQNGSPPCRWWDDDNSPFKSFARAYASIRHGKGNSFAKGDSSEPSDAEKVHETTRSGVQLKKIDVMRWNL